VKTEIPGMQKKQYVRHIQQSTPRLKSRKISNNSLLHLKELENNKRNLKLVEERNNKDQSRIKIQKINETKTYSF
jgi:hypothetical protein